MQDLSLLKLIVLKRLRNLHKLLELFLDWLVAPFIPAQFGVTPAMKPDSIQYPATRPEVSVYECEVRLKFRLIEEQGALCMNSREELLEQLLDALTCGNDDYLETLETQVAAQEISEIEVSPQMRRQMIRLRNTLD